MRREQVHKICANHHIVPGMRLAPMISAESSWCWHAQDYSEGDTRTEHLCARFKNKDIAQRFKECFDACLNQLETEKKSGGESQSPRNMSIRALLADDSASESNSGSVTLRSLLAEGHPKTQLPQGVGPKTPEGVPPAEQNKVSLSALFTPAAAEWNCSTCYVKNIGSAGLCVAFEIPRQLAASTVRPRSAEVPKPRYPNRPLSARCPKWTCDACYVQNKANMIKCAACETLKPGATAPAVNSGAVASAAAPPQAFKFGSTGGFSFGGQSSSQSAFGSGFTQAVKSENSASITAEKGGISKETTGGFKFPTSASSFTFGSTKVPDVSKENDAPTVFAFTKPLMPVFVAGA